MEDRAWLRKEWSSETTLPLAGCHSRVHVCAGEWDLLVTCTVFSCSMRWGLGRQEGGESLPALLQDFWKGPWLTSDFTPYYTLGWKVLTLAVYHGTAAVPTYLIYPSCACRNYFLQMRRLDRVKNILKLSKTSQMVFKNCSFSYQIFRDTFSPILSL